MSLNEQLQAKLTEARSLLAEGKLEEAKAAREGAQRLVDAINEARLIEETAAKYAPTRPAVPGTGAGAVPEVIQESAKSATGVLDGEGDGQGGGDLGEKTRQAAYVTRFGDEQSTIKGILTDLHGNSYQGQYWAQKAAFGRYLRGGEQHLKQGDHKLLREMVMNPSAIKMALDQGVDDISSFRATMVEAADTLGGYLVPVDFQMRMIEKLARLTVMRGRASQMNTSRDRVEMPEATGGDGIYTSPVRVTWVDETPTVGQLTPNYVTFGLRGINVHTAMAETPISRNLLEDIAFDIEGYLSRKLAEAVALDEDKQFLIGNGVGKPRGILPGGVNGFPLTQVVTGSASAVTWNGLIDTTYGLDAQYRVNGVWMANKATYNAIAKLQDSTSGNYLWNPFQFEGGEGDTRVRTLLGYPCIENEWMPSVAANAIAMLFGDLSAYQIVDRLGMTVERYLDSQTARQNLVYFVMRRRLGGELVESWKLLAHKCST
jgi:HK97 family phage major capsid protein